MPINCGYLFGYGQQDPIDQALSDFLKDEVELSSSDLKQTEDTVDELISHLNYLFLSVDANEALSGLPASDVIQIRELWEPQRLSNSLKFDVLVVFKLGSQNEQWGWVKKPQDDMLTSVLYKIRRKSPDLDDVTVDYKCKMATYADKVYFDEVHYDQFCPLKFRRKTKEFILSHLRGLKFSGVSNFELQVKDSNCPALNLLLKIDEQQIALKIIPALEIVQVKTEVSVGWIWSNNVLKVKSTLMVAEDAYWRRCYKTEEDSWKLFFLKSKPSQILLKVFKVIKTLNQNNNCPLSKINSYVFKYFFMMVSEKFGFCYHKKSFKEAFKMILVQLEETLRGGTLPNYFEPDINVLCNLELNLLRFLSGYLKSIIDYDDYIDFIMENKIRVPVQLDEDLLLLEQAKDYYLSMENNDQTLKVANVFHNTEEQLKDILKTHFIRDDIINRISIKFHDIQAGGSFTTNLTTRQRKMIVIFRLDGTIWLPKAEHDPEVLEDEFQPYHCTWSKYTDDFKQDNQAMKYGKEDTCYQMDSGKFCSTINGEISSAVNNFYSQNDIKINTMVYDDRVDIKVKYETLGQSAIFSIIPAVCFVKNEQIPNSFLLVSPKVIGKSYWKRNYDIETQWLVDEMDNFDDGFRKQVLDILLTALTVTPLHKLDADVLVGAVLNNTYHHGWSTKSVSKMLKFILDYLVVCLDQRLMKHHLEILRNVLKIYDEPSLDLCAEYLRSFKANSFKQCTYHFVLYRKENL